MGRSFLPRIFSIGGTAESPVSDSSRVPAAIGSAHAGTREVIEMKENEPTIVVGAPPKSTPGSK